MTELSKGGDTKLQHYYTSQWQESFQKLYHRFLDRCIFLLSHKDLNAPMKTNFQTVTAKNVFVEPQIMK